MTLLLLGVTDAVSPQAGRAAETVPLTHTCDDEGYCDLTVEPHSGGTITSSPRGIDCGTDCSEPYFFNDALIEVTLSAKPHSGWRFESWNISCANEPQPGETTCQLFFSEDTIVRPTFVRESYRLTVTVAGTGTGTVKGTGISCPGDCEQDYAAGTGVQLTEEPSGGSTWGGWSGNCTGTGTCNLSMTADRNVTATFNAPVVVKRTLKVSVTGTGKVTASGIDCPTDCEEQYDSGTTVQLTATPGSGMTLTSWGGDCSGAATTCSLVMSSDKTVSATFAAVPPATHRLTVTVTGSGKVTGSGIDCPGDCTQDYAVGTAASLSAAPAAGYTVQWSGDCAHAGTSASCGVTMSQTRSVVAAFSAPGVTPPVTPPTVDQPVATPAAVPVIDEELDPLPAKLPPAVEQVIVKIDGTGNVTSAPASRVVAGASAARRINCGTGGFDCYGEYRPEQALTLTAKPASGYAFERWTGACVGSNKTCRVVTSDARTVTAVFEQTGRGAAVAASLREPRLRVRWQSSIGAGNLVVQGSTSLPANARVDVRRPAGGPLATLRLKLQGGAFRQTLPLRRGALRGGARLFPGGFTVALTGRSASLKLPLQMQTIAIPAPAEGVVRKAFRSALENGREVARFPAGAKEAWANFRFETQPRLAQKLVVRWYWPDGKLLGEVRKSNRPVISSYLSLTSGLPSGLWVAELRAGKRVVQRLSVRVG
jgi:List-Bact-rpt repeat protein